MFIGVDVLPDGGMLPRVVGGTVRWVRAPAANGAWCACKLLWVLLRAAAGRQPGWLDQRLARAAVLRAVLPTSSGYGCPGTYCTYLSAL